MPNRNLEGGYRYGYQGEHAEKDPETGKEAFELRLWDSRIGRWLTTDPYRQHSSPYLGMGNNPITRVDHDGGCDGTSCNCHIPNPDYPDTTGVQGLDEVLISNNPVWELIMFTDWNGPLVQFGDVPYKLNKYDRDYVVRWFSQDPHINDPFSIALVQMVRNNEPIDRTNANMYYGEKVVRDVAAMEIIGMGAGLAAGAQGGGGNQRTNMSYSYKGHAKVEMQQVHGNSLKSMRPTWGYKLYRKDGAFLKNGITSKPRPESRYTREFMKDKYMIPRLHPNRRAAWDWEYQENLISPGPLNKNLH